MMESCSRDQVGGVCAVGARLQGGEGLQGVEAGGDGSQPGGRSLGPHCPVPAQFLPQVSEKRTKRKDLSFQRQSLYLRNFFRK